MLAHTKTICIMKRLLSIIAIAFLSIVTMTSCEKSPEELLVGNWELTQMKMTAQGMTIDINPAEAGIALSMTFKADGSYQVTSSAEGVADTETGSFVYNQTSQTIIFTNEEESYSLTVGSLNEEELVITQTEEDITSSMYFTKR